MRVLVVEDDRETAEFIKQALGSRGHVVEHASTGGEGLQIAKSTTYDVAIVDRMLPGLDGLSLVKQLRAEHNPVPVLFLTNLGGIDDRVEGLESGGDDYLVKPFAVSELLARMNALVRRLPTAQTCLKAGDLEMDLLTRAVTKNGQKIDLQPREFNCSNASCAMQAVSSPEQCCLRRFGISTLTQRRTVLKPTSVA